MAAGTQLSKYDAEMKGIDRRYILDWEKNNLKDGILYISYKVEFEPLISKDHSKSLICNFFIHYGFPANLHSDKGANFER